MAAGVPHERSSSNKIIVAAMDFGTTYSGCTFSLKDDYNKNPLDIKKPETWNASSRALQSLKTPTVILLDKNKMFVAFGYEAEEKYQELVTEDEHHDYYYFRRFKMKLHTTSIMNVKFTIKDETGKECEALTVFKLSMYYLKTFLESIVTKRGYGARPEDIQWVLTVPAIWSDSAKQFMRIAATKEQPVKCLGKWFRDSRNDTQNIKDVIKQMEDWLNQAGIKNENLTIALEPEAASVLCMKLPLTNVDQRSRKVTRTQGFPPGTRYMVVDMGGGTVDITVHEVVNDKSLKEVAPPTGGHWGGTTVDESFVGLLKRIVGDNVYKTFEKENQEDVIDLYREFETKKRNIKVEPDNKKKPLTIPSSLLRTFEKMNRGSNVAERIASDRAYSGRIIWKNDKIRVDPNILCQLFDTSINKTVEEIKKLLAELSARGGVDTLLLVGGCSESPLVQQKIKESFPNKRVIIPEDAGLSVLKGAVIFGHCPTSISSRIAKFSYGTRVYRDFDDRLHPRDKLVVLGQKRKCKDVFAPHVIKGQELLVGVAQENKRYTCLEQEQTSLVFDFFTSTEKSPEFVTDPSCTFIGQLEVMLDGKGSGRNKAALVSVIYGGTEIVARGVHEETHEKTEVKMTLLKK